jgi:Flp pilus assembly protein TadG
MAVLTKNRRRIWRHRRGTEIIEAALVMLPLVMLSFGTVEFGLYFHAQNVLQGAAREGARAGAVPGAADADINAVIAAVTANSVIKNKYTTTISRNSPQNGLITVVVKSQWSQVGISPMGFVKPTNGEIKGHAVMRME